MATVDLYGLGVHSRVQCEGPRADELEAAVRAAWSRCLTGTGAELEGSLIRVHLAGPDDAPDADAETPDAPRDAAPDQPVLLRGTEIDGLLQSLTQSVTTVAIKAQSGRLLMVHAGAVTDPDTGRALAYIAPGGTGKTTLSRLLGATHGYVTDETVAFDDDGRLVPYEKPLSIRPQPFNGTKQETSPDELGLLRVHPDARLHQVVLLRRDESVTTPRLEEISAFDAIPLIAPESSALSELERPLQRLVGLLDQLNPVVVAHYAEASDLAPLLVERLHT